MIPVTPLLYSLIAHPRVRVLYRFYHIYLLQNDEVYVTVVRERNGKEAMWGVPLLSKLDAFCQFRAVSEHIARERIGGEGDGRQPVGQPGT